MNSLFSHRYVKKARQRPLPLPAGFQSAARGLSQVSLPKGGVDRPQQVFSEKPEQFQPSEATDSNVKPLVCNGRASGSEVEATGQREESKSRRESVRSEPEDQS